MKPGATMRPRASMVRVASPARPGPTATMRSPSSATSAEIAGRAAAVQHGAVLDQERPGHGYWASSTIFTVFILSPTLTLSTTSIPLVTMPKTVYWPSRKLAGARQM